MLNRRKFLRNTGALAAGSLLVPVWGCDNSSGDKKEETTAVEEVLFKRNAGVQLYTLRSKFPDKFDEQMRQLAEIGYTELESFAQKTHYCGLSVEDYKSITNNYGLKTVSSHIRTGLIDPKIKFDGPLLPDVEKGYLVGNMTQNLKSLIDVALKMGQSYLVLAYLEEFEYRDQEAWNQVIQLIIETAEICEKEGIQFCYHNHAFEFEAINEQGMRFYDFLLANTDPEKVKMELDFYWTAKAGVDPVLYFHEYPGRFPLWHVKDMDNTPEKNFTEVGAGVIDFTTYFEYAEIAGMKHFFIEQDQTAGEPIESLRTSFQNLSQMIPGLT